MLLFTSCGDPPGKGPKAETGYTICQPVINDLLRYKKEHGSLPDSLGVITAQYTPEVRQRLKEYQVNLLLKVTGVDFDLEFTYTGPGVNHCTYSSIQDKWYCSGYY